MIKAIVYYILWIAMMCALMWVTMNIFTIKNYVLSEWPNLLPQGEPVGIAIWFHMLGEISFLVLIWVGCSILVLMPFFGLILLIKKVFDKKPVLALEENKK